MPAPAGPDERQIDVDAAKLEDPADFGKVTRLILVTAEAGLAVGNLSSIEALRAYVRSDGSLRLCVVIGELQEVIVAAGRWRELSAEDRLKAQQERFARTPSDPSTLRIPDGHVALMVMMPGFSKIACVVSVNHLYGDLATIDRSVAELKDDANPAKNMGAFATWRKEAFSMLGTALRANDEPKVALAMRMLFWAAVSTPKQGPDLRRMLSAAIAAHDRAGIVTVLVRYRDRVATLIGADLSLPPDLSEQIHSHEMTDVADLVYKADVPERGNN